MAAGRLPWPTQPSGCGTHGPVTIYPQAREGITLMTRKVAIVGAVIAMLAFTVAITTAGSPHFIGNTITKSTSGNSLTVSGKEAGLGDEAQVHIVVTATASCINPGDHHPKAANKASVTAAGDFPVQNG